MNLLNIFAVLDAVYNAGLVFREDASGKHGDLTALTKWQLDLIKDLE